MKFSQSFIQSVQHNDQLGAGNFLYQLVNMDVDHSNQCIFLDMPIKDVNGEWRSSFSLADLIRNADAWGAYYLLQNVTEKDPVALYFPDNFNYFIHFLALTRIGAIPVCINHKLAPDVVVEFIRRVNASHIMMEAQLAPQIAKGLSAQEISTLLLEKAILIPDAKHGIPFVHTNDDVVLLAHTSGTTGIPKAVIFTHSGFYVGVQSQLDKQVGDSILCALPHSHSAATSILMSSILRGVSVRIQSAKSSEDIITATQSFKPQLIVAFPKTLTDLCRHDLEPADFDSLSYWISTGDANHEPHIRKLISLGNCEIRGQQVKGSIFIDNLGSSEFGFAMFRNIHTPFSNNYKRCIGKPFNWVQSEILDEQGQRAADNIVGYLGVRSESVTAGYWNNHLLTEKNRLNGYWLTGDLGYRDSNGIFFHVDRISDKITTSEGPLYSCLVEELILSNRDDIFECSIIGVATKSSLQTATIAIEMKADQIAKDNLLAELNLLLQAHKHPQLSHLTFESAHENVGATGKKLKRKIREELSL